eukprot:15059689-Alexandrium_andersonii.AAC.1
MPLEGGVCSSPGLVCARLARGGRADQPGSTGRREGVGREAGLEQVVVRRTREDLRRASGRPRRGGNQQVDGLSGASVAANSDRGEARLLE